MPSLPSPQVPSENQEQRNLLDFDLGNLRITDVSKADFLNVCQTLEFSLPQNMLASLYEAILARQRPNLKLLIKDFEPKEEIGVSFATTWHGSEGKLAESYQLTLIGHEKDQLNKSWVIVTLCSSDLNGPPRIEIEYSEHKVKESGTEPDRLALYEEVLSNLSLKSFAPRTFTSKNATYHNLNEKTQLLLREPAPKPMAFNKDPFLALRNDILPIVLGATPSAPHELRAQQIMNLIDPMARTPFHIIGSLDCLENSWREIGKYHKEGAMPFLNDGPLLLPISPASNFEELKACLAKLKRLHEEIGSKTTNEDLVIPLEVRAIDVEPGEAQTIVQKCGYRIDKNLTEHLYAVLIEGKKFDPSFLSRSPANLFEGNFVHYEIVDFSPYESNVFEQHFGFEHQDPNSPYIMIYPDSRDDIETQYFAADDEATMRELAGLDEEQEDSEDEQESWDTGSGYVDDDSYEYEAATEIPQDITENPSDNLNNEREFLTLFIDWVKDSGELCSSDGPIRWQLVRDIGISVMKNTLPESVCHFFESNTVTYDPSHRLQIVNIKLAPIGPQP